MIAAVESKSVPLERGGHRSTSWSSCSSASSSSAVARSVSDGGGTEPRSAHHHRHRSREPLMSHVGKGIYIGGYDSARTSRLLDRAGITSIINLMSRQKYAAGSRRVLHHPMSDFGHDSLQDALLHCQAFIESALKRGEKVLIHCSKGVNRCPAFCLAYFMTTDGRTLRDAYRLIRAKRPQVSVHERYIRQLQVLDVELYGKLSLRIEDLVPTIDSMRSMALFDSHHLPSTFGGEPQISQQSQTSQRSLIGGWTIADFIGSSHAQGVSTLRTGEMNRIQEEADDAKSTSSRPSTVCATAASEISHNASEDTAHLSDIATATTSSEFSFNSRTTRSHNEPMSGRLRYHTRRIYYRRRTERKCVIS